MMAMATAGEVDPMDTVEAEMKDLQFDNKKRLNTSSSKNFKSKGVV